LFLGCDSVSLGVLFLGCDNVSLGVLFLGCDNVSSGVWFLHFQRKSALRLKRSRSPGKH